MRSNTRSALWAVGLVFVVAVMSLADTPFQALPERSDPLWFLYPSGAYRRAADSKIVAYSHEWADSTGHGIPADVVFEFRTATGDTAAAFVWTDPPPGKYYFVESDGAAGTDSILAHPQYRRMGFSQAPPGFVADSAAVAGGVLHWEHVDPDSFIREPRGLNTGVVGTAQLQNAGVSMADLAAQAVGAYQMAPSAAAFNLTGTVSAAGIVVDATIGTGSSSWVGAWTGCYPGDFVALTLTNAADDAASSILEAAVSDTNEVTITRPLGVSGTVGFSFYVIPR